MKKVFTILLAPVLLLQLSSVNTVSAREPLTKTFAQWCQQRDSFADDTKYTIDVMIARAGTKDCQQAERYFNKLTELNLSATKIRNIRPLASLNNLTRLYLINNRINDITPLSRVNDYLPNRLWSFSFNANRVF
jgi:internalin A